jgi:hypothetical protein
MKYSHYLSVLIRFQKKVIKVQIPIRFMKCILAFSIACLSIGCEAPKPALEDYRLKTTSFLDIRQDIVQFSRKLIGCKYKTAGKTNSGFDCSGLVIYVFREFQIPMAASAHAQSKKGKEIELKDATTGDLIFFGSPKQISHVGIISANKKKNLTVIHSSSSRGVIEENIMGSDYWVRRIQKVVSLDSYTKMNDISYNN